jgi:predicted small secreted protein
VEFDEPELRVDFYSEQTEWNKAIGTYSVDFGSLDMARRGDMPSLHVRDIFARSPIDFGKTFRDVGKDIKDGVEGAGKDITRTANNAGNAIADAFKDVGTWMKSLPADISKQLEKLDDKMKEKLLSAAKKMKAAGKDFVTVFNKAKEKLGDKFEEVAKALSDVGDGSFGKDNVDFDLSKGQPSRKKNLYTDPFK